MSKKEPFEYIENRIKQAAENSQPAFDEKAWVKMATLLDKAEHKQRPFLWWWFMLPLLLVVTWGVYTLSIRSDSSETKYENVAKLKIETEQEITPVDKKQMNSIADKTGPALPPEKVTVQKNKPVNNSKLNAAGIRERNTLNQQTIMFTDENKRSSKPVDKLAVTVSKSNSPDKNEMEKNTSFRNKKSKAVRNEVAQVIIDVPGENAVVADAVSDSKIVDANISTKQAVKQNARDEKITAEYLGQNIQKDSVKNTAVDHKFIARDSSIGITQKLKAKKNSPSVKGIYLVASAGADIGSVKLFSFANSTVTSKYGLGIGYQFNNKLSVQTGLYVSDKKYSAGPADYHPKEDSYWNFVQLTGVDASCLVYEIPVSVKFNFINKPATAYYGMVGISSYIMKREGYNYCFNRNNIAYEKYWVYTGNKNLFSILSFAVGIEKQLSSKIALLAEPAISIPLSGVGDGSVKLFSTALQIGIKYRPSAKR